MFSQLRVVLGLGKSCQMVLDKKKKKKKKKRKYTFDCVTKIFILLKNRCSERDAFSFSDINECVRDRGLCTFGECVNLDGGFECRCPEGFLLTDDGKSCIGGLHVSLFIFRNFILIYDERTSPSF